MLLLNDCYHNSQTVLRTICQNTVNSIFDTVNSLLNPSEHAILWRILKFENEDSKTATKNEENVIRKKIN